MLPVACSYHPCCSPCSSVGGCKAVEPSGPCIFMPDINFHPFQYFMSVTIKQKKGLSAH